MIAITVISWIAVVLVLIAYATNRQLLYAWANVVLCVPVALPAIVLGAWSTAGISLAFGVISLHLLWNTHRMKKAWRRVHG
jgi:hypothetical protein